MCNFTMAKEENTTDFSRNVVRFLVNYFVRFGLAGVVIYSCWIAIENYNYWFSWHVILCTFGYVPLMAEAIMLFTGDELWSRQVTKKTKNIIHGVLISVGTAFAIIGNALVFHYISPGYHLYTAHGITGLISMLFLIASLVLGLVANYPQKMNQFLSIPPVWYKFAHNFFGLLAYAIGIASLCYAFYTKWFIFYTTEEGRLVALIVTILGCLWSVNGALVSGYNQIGNLLFGW